jgi:hypothetical protein
MEKWENVIYIKNKIKTKEVNNRQNLTYASETRIPKKKKSKVNILFWKESV